MAAILTKGLSGIIFGLPDEATRALPVINAPPDATRIVTHFHEGFARARVSTPSGRREFMLIRTPVGLALDFERSEVRTSQPLPLWWTLFRCAQHLWNQITK